MELDMGKFDSWVAGLRDTIINASELAKNVASLQMQVGEMTTTMESLRSLNRTLDENLSWSRSERDRLETANHEAQVVNTNLRSSLHDTIADRDRYQQLADERASIIAALRADYDGIGFKNLELEEENKALKAKLDTIQSAYKIAFSDPAGAAGTGQVQAKPETVSETKPIEPFLHPVTGVLQGRDPETKQFVPTREEAKEDKPGWMGDKQSSGF